MRASVCPWGVASELGKAILLKGSARDFPTWPPTARNRRVSGRGRHFARLKTPSRSFAREWWKTPPRRPRCDATLARPKMPSFEPRHGSHHGGSEASARIEARSLSTAPAQNMPGQIEPSRIGGVRREAARGPQRACVAPAARTVHTGSGAFSRRCWMLRELARAGRCRVRHRSSRWAGSGWCAPFGRPAGGGGAGSGPLGSGPSRRSCRVRVSGCLTSG